MEINEIMEINFKPTPKKALNFSESTSNFYISPHYSNSYGTLCHYANFQLIFFMTNLILGSATLWLSRQKTF